MMEAIPIILLSAFKFLPCPSLAVAMGYNFWETILITVPAGVAATVFFFLASNFLMERARRRKLTAVSTGKEKVKRQFTWLNKNLIRVKHRFGVVGIAFFTPTLLSIPLGSIIMAKFFKHKKEALPALMLSVIGWGVLLTILSVQFNLRF